MSFEVILEDLNKVNINERQTNNENNQYDEIFHFLKYSYKYKTHEYADKKIEELSNDFNEFFPFTEDKYKSSLRKTKVKEFCLEWFKQKIPSKKQMYKQRLFLEEQRKVKLQIPYLIETDNVRVLDVLMGIFSTESDFDDYIKKLIPGSFGLKYRFKLDSPYFSKDDDELYIIDNPVMKEKVWKVPIIKGSSWKGLLLKAARKKLGVLIGNNSIKDVLDYYISVTRIFGTGSNEYREIEDEIKKLIDENGKKNEDLLVKQFIKYALSDIGLNLNIKKNGETVAKQILEQIVEKNIFAVKKGRVVFYPTYFDEISLEAINPHNRNTKAGSGPIYYEVVPKDSKGILQIIYIPYDAITLPMKEIRKQIKFDYSILKELIKYAIEEMGIGAKEKLGWGKATIVKNPEEKYCFSNMEGICDE